MRRKWRVYGLFNNKLQEAAQLYGGANVDSALSEAKLLSEAEFFFGNMGIGN